MPSDASAAARAIDAVCRIESSRVIARVARMVRDVGLAEELAQDAFLAALEQWPEAGIPENPGAWLTAVAKRRAVDRIRRERNFASKEEAIGYEAESGVQADDFEFEEDPIEDDLLRLIFTSCHPLLPKESRAALTLRVVGGLTTEEIARAFLVPEPTMAQRIVRAKRTLAEAKVSFELPRGPDREARLASVLEVIYLIFNEGYASTSGDRWIRHELCDEALRLGRILAELVPHEPEAHGLASLMEIQASRLRSRVGADGKPVLLLDQDRAKWDRLLIGRGLTALERAGKQAEKREQGLGSYGLQAAIAACHARALRPEDTDWVRIAALYDALVELTPSPIVDLNRAVAVCMAYGPEAGLEILEDLVAEGALEAYPALHAARGELLAKSGLWTGARAAFERAAELSRNVPEKELLMDRARACSQGALWWKAKPMEGGR